jgi:hypothetical protein
MTSTARGLDEDGAALLRRAQDWAAGAAAGRAYDEELAARMTPTERIAEAVELTRIAERLRDSALHRSGT